MTDTKAQESRSQPLSLEDVTTRLSNIYLSHDVSQHSPPPWLSEAPSQLQRAYPQDLFEGVMHHHRETLPPVIEEAF